MRVILDTNVLIAGLLWSGPPHTLLEHARTGSVSIVSSPALLAELATVIDRTKFSTILVRSTIPQARLLAEVRRLVDVIDPPPPPRQVCRDPDDDQVLALAAAETVDLIISGDADLLTLGSFVNIPIVTPTEAIRRLGPFQVCEPPLIHTAKPALAWR